MSTLPSGTVTFLFTDIEGSTRLWQEKPQAMSLAQARHDVILREAVEANNGIVFQLIGDSIAAAFRNALDGLCGALTAQRGLLSEKWGTTGPIRVRMGLHTGAAEVSASEPNRYAEGYTTIASTQRVMSAAHGGQVLLTQTTLDLLQNDLPEGVSLRDMGEHRLKDLRAPLHLYQLVAPDLPQGFPPLKSLNSLPNNLPVQVTSFIGREREIAEAKRLLERTRLLTLTGPGGTGKTRLSLQLAADMLDAYAAGVWLVELAPISDPSLVPQAVASTLGLREQPGRPLVDTLIDYLRGKSILLILDNCEHLIDACAQIATAMLSAGPKIKIIPSSREALGVAGETAYRVPSLSLPDARQASLQAYPLEAFMQAEAVRLFVERAQAAQPHFALTVQNLSAVAQICRRLDGIPLALELAAARVKLFSVEQIAARLDDRFRLLTGGSRTALPRQQTLGALIDWSYDLLPAAEQEALGRLSVFSGGWMYEAAETVLGPDTLDLLSHLVDKSLVVAEENTQSGETRYHLLETIRQYGRDKLFASGGVSTARDLHLAAYLQLAAQAEALLEGPQMVVWLDRLEIELDNIRGALEWALEQKPDTALQLAVSLAVFWRSRGYLTEGRTWLVEAMTRLAALPQMDGEAGRANLARRARGLSAAGMLAFGMGELNTARAWLEESAELARQLGERKTLGGVLGMLGLTVLWLGDATATDAVIEEGLSITRTTEDQRDLVAIKMLQANRATQLHHDYAAAQIYLQETTQLLRDELGNPWIAAMYFFGMGQIAAAQGNYGEALAHFNNGEKHYGQLGDERMVYSMQSERAHIERRLGHIDQAVALYTKTLLAWQEFGQPAALAHELECFAFIAGTQAKAERGVTLLGAAEALREEINSPMRAIEREEYDQNVAALRAQMDAAAFASAWAEGRLLTLDQAVQFAIGKYEEGRSNA